jgi:hypothetical protein
MPPNTPKPDSESATGTDVNLIDGSVDATTGQATPQDAITPMPDPPSSMKVLFESAAVPDEKMDEAEAPPQDVRVISLTQLALDSNSSLRHLHNETKRREREAEKLGKTAAQLRESAASIIKGRQRGASEQAAQKIREAVEKEERSVLKRVRLEISLPLRLKAGRLKRRTTTATMRDFIRHCILSVAPRAFNEANIPYKIIEGNVIIDEVNENVERVVAQCAELIEDTICSETFVNKPIGISNVNEVLAEFGIITQVVEEATPDNDQASYLWKELRDHLINYLEQRSKSPNQARGKSPKKKPRAKYTKKKAEGGTRENGRAQAIVA